MRLFTYEWGDPAAPPLLCLHGVVGHGLRFRRMAEERFAQRFRVVALDLRGHGYSGFEPPWDLATHLDDIRETAGALGVESATWIGHSFGGRLLMELTAASPRLVERLVLLDPAIWVPPPYALERAEAERADRSFSSLEEALVLQIDSERLYHTPQHVLEEEIEQHLARSEDGRLRFRYSQSAVIAAYGELAKPPPPFEELRVPTLLIRGALTDVVPEILVDVYREGVGDVLQVATVPGGHSVLWDAYAETGDAIDRFLAG